MTNINHHENTFQREEDSTECIVRSDAVRWMDAQHQTLHVTLFCRWTRETTNKYIDSFVKKGQMPPGVVFLTALVNEGYVYALRNNVWYWAQVITIYLDYDGNELERITASELDFYTVEKNSWLEKLLNYALDYLN